MRGSEAGTSAPAHDDDELALRVIGGRSPLSMNHALLPIFRR